VKQCLLFMVVVVDKKCEVVRGSTSGIEGDEEVSL